MLIIDVIDSDKTKKINIPTDWEDMTLTYWCGIYRIVDKYRKMKKFREDVSEKEKKNHLRDYTKQMQDANLDFLEKRDIINMNKEMFKYITQISDEDIERVDMEKAVRVLGAIDVIQEDYKPKGIKSFEFENETYYFPTNQMQENTFGDYIEATQIELNLESMTNGNYDVLPQQMAILCRKFGEKYDEEVIEERTEKFRTLTMDIILEFSFFLSKQSQILESALKTYSEEREKGEALSKEK